jgi:hypothetical protein
MINPLYGTALSLVLSSLLFRFHLCTILFGHFALFNAGVKRMGLSLQISRPTTGLLVVQAYWELDIFLFGDDR